MKKLFKQIGWLCTLSVLLLAGCQQEELLSISSNSDIAKVSTRAASTYDYLGNANGIFVLSEGNMMNENGTLSFIDGSATGYPAQNWVYRTINTMPTGHKELGNVAQDLFISDNKMYILSQNGKRLTSLPGAQHILKTRNTLKHENDFNPGFPTAWSNTTPTHLAVKGDKIFVRTNSGVVVTDTAGTSGTPTPISGISKPSRIRMAMVKNSNVKYLYVGSENNKVYRINTNTNAVDSITVQGKVAGVTAVRRNNSVQYVWALCIKPDGTAALQKISGTTVQATHNISISQPFAPSLLIPSVGLCCYAGGTNDVLYFRSNGWDPTKIYKVDTGAASPAATEFYTVPTGIDSNARIVYGDLGVNPANGNVYFGYVGNWTSYISVNGVVQLNNTGGVAKEYRASYSVPDKIDSRFTAGIYFRQEFDM